MRHTAGRAEGKHVDARPRASTPIIWHVGGGSMARIVSSLARVAGMFWMLDGMPSLRKQP